MMKKLYLIIACICGLNAILYAQKTVITGTLEEVVSGQRQMVSLQKLGWMDRNFPRTELSSDKKFRLESESLKTGFYRLTLLNRSYFVYLNPGDELDFEERNGKIIVSGKGEIVGNQLLIDNQKFQEEFHRLPVEMRIVFGKERAEGAWRVYCSKMETLKKADVSREFKEKYKGFAGIEYWMSMIGGLGYYENNKLSPGYVKALQRVKLTENMVNHGSWYELLESWLTYKLNEKKVRLTAYENWLKEKASLIRNKGLREAYLIQQIELEVLRGEFVGLPEAVKAVKKMIRKPENQAKVKEQMELMKEGYARYDKCLPGTDVGDFEFNDREGKTVKLGDLKGKYVYIDVWSTGCLPCKQEIPFLADLEKAMEERNIVFVSVSLDTKNEVWQKFIREKNLGGLQLIAEKGFKHPFCATLGMSGIPQFILLDKDSKIINFNAKRPSNPVLWNYLDRIVD